MRVQPVEYGHNQDALPAVRVPRIPAHPATDSKDAIGATKHGFVAPIAATTVSLRVQSDTQKQAGVFLSV
jgi:hypothetical protein